MKRFVKKALPVALSTSILLSNSNIKIYANSNNEITVETIDQIPDEEESIEEIVEQIQNEDENIEEDIQISDEDGNIEEIIDETQNEDEIIEEDIIEEDVEEIVDEIIEEDAEQIVDEVIESEEEIEEIPSEDGDKSDFIGITTLPEALLPEIKLPEGLLPETPVLVESVMPMISEVDTNKITDGSTIFITPENLDLFRDPTISSEYGVKVIDEDGFTKVEVSGASYAIGDYEFSGNYTNVVFNCYVWKNDVILNNFNVFNEYDVTGTSAFQVGGMITVVLKGNNSLETKTYNPGNIELNQNDFDPQNGAALGIRAQGSVRIKGNGSLDAISNANGPGIGTNQMSGGQAILIEGGTINAKGGENCPGIGATSEAAIQKIIINGGNVTATGGKNAAGIGNGGLEEGGYSNPSNIIILDGKVTAFGGEGGGAGIGSGVGNCSDVLIYGGNITATGGSGGGAGIGTGLNGLMESWTELTIMGGTIKATGTDGGAGIGYGRGTLNQTGNIVIRGGDITAHSDTGAGIGSAFETGTPNPKQLYNIKNGKIIIQNGNITATSDRGAGIGTGLDSKIDNIEIGHRYISSRYFEEVIYLGFSEDGVEIILPTDGMDYEGYSYYGNININATSNTGAGIGSGEWTGLENGNYDLRTSVKDININRNENGSVIVNATSTGNGAGIGSGYAGEMSRIYITSSNNEGTENDNKFVVNGTSKGNGAGIGTGENSMTEMFVPAVDVSSNGVTINARSEGEGAGLGSGKNSVFWRMLIEGGMSYKSTSKLTAYSGNGGAGIGTGVLDASDKYDEFDSSKYKLGALYIFNIEVDAYGDNGGVGIGAGKGGMVEGIGLHNGIVVTATGTLDGEGIGVASGGTVDYIDMYENGEYIPNIRAYAEDADAINVTAPMANHNYIVNAKLEKAISMDSETIITANSTSSDDSVELNLPAGYKNFAYVTRRIFDEEVLNDDGQSFIHSYKDGNRTIPLYIAKDVIIEDEVIYTKHDYPVQAYNFAAYSVLLKKPNDLVVDEIYEADKVITGTGDPGAEVVIDINGDKITTTVDPDGNWEVNVEDFDINENDDILFNQIIEDTYLVDEAEEVVAGLEEIVVNPINKDDSVITGTGEPGADIIVTLENGKEIPTVVGPDGKWKVDVEEGDLVEDEIVNVSQSVNDQIVDEKTETVTGSDVVTDPIKPINPIAPIPKDPITPVNPIAPIAPIDRDDDDDDDDRDEIVVPKTPDVTDNGDNNIDEIFDIEEDGVPLGTYIPEEFFAIDEDEVPLGTFSEEIQDQEEEAIYIVDSFDNVNPLGTANIKENPKTGETRNYSLLASVGLLGGAMAINRKKRNKNKI